MSGIGRHPRPAPNRLWARDSPTVPSAGDSLSSSRCYRAISSVRRRAVARGSRTGSVDHTLDVRESGKAAQPVKSETFSDQLHFRALDEAIDVDSEAYCWRRSGFFWRMRASLGLACAQATTLCSQVFGKANPRSRSGRPRPARWLHRRSDRNFRATRPLPSWAPTPLSHT